VYNKNNQKIKVEIGVVVSDDKIGWAWTSDDSRIKPASGVIESLPAELDVIEANAEEWERNSNLTRYGEYVALKAFFADFLAALHGEASLYVTDDPNVQKLLSAQQHTCDTRCYDLDEVTEVKIAAEECCDFLAGVVQERHEALRPLWLNVVMDILYANLGVWVPIGKGREESPAWHAARAALGLPPLPPRQMDTGDDELADLKSQYANPDAPASSKPAKEDKPERWPGERRLRTEINKATDAADAAMNAWADTRARLRSLARGDEGYVSALAAVIRAKGLVEGALAATRAVAAMYDEEKAKAQGKVDSDASEKTEK
jgi:hypothetical protein